MTDDTMTMDSMENSEMAEGSENPHLKLTDDAGEDVALPPGIKTEAVLSFLGNISNALTDIANGINQTITMIVTEGTKPMEAEDMEEGESNDVDED